MPSVPRHEHPDYWTQREHERFEDRVTGEIHELRNDLKALNRTVILMVGGVSLLAFLIPIFAPLLRTVFGVPA